MHNAIVGNVPSVLRPLDRAAVLGGSLTQTNSGADMGIPSSATISFTFFLAFLRFSHFFSPFFTYFWLL